MRKIRPSNLRNFIFSRVSGNSTITIGGRRFYTALTAQSSEQKAISYVHQGHLALEQTNCESVKSVGDALTAIKELYQGSAIALEPGKLPLVPSLSHPINMVNIDPSKSITPEEVESWKRLCNTPENTSDENIKSEIRSWRELYTRIGFYNNCDKQLVKMPDSMGIDDIQVLPLYGMWYRGQYCSSFNLKPKIYRPEDTGQFYESPTMFTLFQYDNPHLASSLDNTFEWLTMMQHYGLPTPLLDWTEGVLQALYFAVDPTGSSERAAAENAVVYILDAFKLNQLTLKYLPIPPGFKATKNESNSLVFKPDDFHTIIRAEMVDSRSFEHLQSKEDVRHAIDSIQHRFREAYKIFSNPYECLIVDENDQVNKYSTTLAKDIGVDNSFINQHKSSHDPNGSSGNVDKKKEIDRKNEQIRDLVFGKPVAVAPRRTNPRLKAQTGVFTLHGGNNKDLSSQLVGDDLIRLPDSPKCLKVMNENLVKKSGKLRNNFLFKFEIEAKYKESIRRELAALGINESSMYTDLPNQSEYISKHWIFSKPELTGQKPDEVDVESNGPKGGSISGRSK